MRGGGFISFFRKRGVLWSIGVSFFLEGDLFFFFVGAGSPLLGGNRAFLAESSDRLAIKNGVSEKS